MQQFATRLIALRKERDMTQEDLAGLLNKKRSTVSGYETEGKEPDFDTVCFLAEFFGVSTDYLLGLSNERTHTEAVFYHDTVNFEKNFKNLPIDMRQIVSSCFDSFYLLLNRDMKLRRPERLKIYRDLLYSLWSRRADIRKTIEASGGAVTDPVMMSDLMALQNQLKNEISAQLDRLMQADMEIAFSVKNGETGGSSARSAM